MAAFQPISAKFAKVRFGNAANSNVVVTAKKWTVTPTADKLDTTNFEGNGYATYISGILQCDFTVEGDWDSANNYFASPPAFTLGTKLTNVILYTYDIGSPFWSFPLAIIFEVPMSAAVRETVTFSFNCTGSGTFIMPNTNLGPVDP